MTRVEVLGSCGAWPEPGRACSSFLLEHDDYRIVVDLGYGVLSRLLDALGSARADGLDAAIVTHRHADHVADLHGLFRARSLGRPGAARLPLYAGPGVVEAAEALETGPPGVLREGFEVHPLPSAPISIGPFLLESCALPHHVPNAGIRLIAPGVTIAYTGDSGPSPRLAVLGRDADIFIVDATDYEQQSPDSPSDGLNLTARQAGEAATAANARRLLLTHFWPGNDRELSRRSAAAAFAGDVLLADEGLEIVF